MIRRRSRVRYNGTMTIERFLGVDLAWAEHRPAGAPNETGLALLDPTGRVLDAGWTRGLDETIAWIETATGGQDALMFVDAPLVVDNHSGQRLCETQVGQRYGRWKVSANTTNRTTPHLAGVTLRQRLQLTGWQYGAGHHGPPTSGRTLSECFPYTTLVGAAEFGYDLDGQRPRYKRKPKAMRAVQWKPMRAAACDDLLRRMARLRDADPPLLLASHPVSGQLLAEPSPTGDGPYKHREDLLDALLCAWTAALWHRHGLARCQVLGPPEPSPSELSPSELPPPELPPPELPPSLSLAGQELVATIIAPAIPAQRRPDGGAPPRRPTPPPLPPLTRP